MSLLGFLIIFPIAVAVVLLLLNNDRVRKVIVSFSAVVIGLASVILTVMNFGGGWVDFGGSWAPVVDYVCLAISAVVALCVLFFGFKYKNVLACVLGLIQGAGGLVFDFVYAHHLPVEGGLYVDQLTLLMGLVVGVVGSGICVYALGYMKDFQEHHKDSPDRRPGFFALMFLFLAAMFGIIFSNNMVWLFAAWEVTTLCSFLLIAYTRTQEAIKNAFRQIVMNLIGGLAFLVALYFIAIEYETLGLAQFVDMAFTFAMDGQQHLVVLPITCLALAGITKAAQMPFHTWLLGAMVAPTPTSALLHSSTMVKAGVFMLVKLAPVFAVSALPGTMVVLVGGVTFLLCSFMAISQSNAKRVLAYSTVANLGLIVACSGVGTPEAVWAAVLLILFHAIAKSLLFLCVGTAEHHLDSRDIEDMDLLFEKMPRLARFMMLGIMVMFIAPFGMIIAKWATLYSFVGAGQLPLILLLAFGSAATFLFWAKWLGKLSGIAGAPANIEKTVHRTEWVSTMLMVVLIIIACGGLPLVSQFLVVPYIQTISPYALYFAQASASLPAIENANLWLMSILALGLFVFLFAGLGRGKARRVEVYMAGVGVNNEKRSFRNSLSQETKATSRNWYMDSVFGESRITPWGELFCGFVICAVLVLSVVYLLGIW